MNYGDLHYLLLLAFNRSNKAIVRQTAKGDLAARSAQNTGISLGTS